MSILLSLSSVLIIEGVHQPVVRLLFKSVGDVTHVGVIASESVHPEGILFAGVMLVLLSGICVMIEIMKLDLFIIRGRGRGTRLLHQKWSTIVMELSPEPKPKERSSNIFH